MSFTQITKEEAKGEIKKLDAEIDEEVYKLYGITEEEQKIIEDSLKWALDNMAWSTKMNWSNKC